MNRITLPSGATADLREAADVTERQRRPIKRLQARLVGNSDFMAAVNAAQGASGGKSMSQAAQLKIAAGMGSAFDELEDLNDALIAAVVAGWSYGFPVSADSAQDLPGRDLDALREACGPYLTQLMPGFEASPDSDSPTVPSIG